MTERDLENLKHLPVPPQRADRKRAAINAALAKFDAVEKSPEESSQGNVVPFRQTETSEPKRSFRMIVSSRQSQALAASVVALAIVAPIAFQNLKDGRPFKPTSYSEVSTGLVSGAGGSTNAAPPAPPAPIAVAPKAAPPLAQADPQAAQVALAPKTAASAPEHQVSEKDKILPPDIAGKTQIGANGQEPVDRQPAGLGAVGSYTPQPWKSEPDSKLAAAPEPVPPAPTAAPAKSKGYAADPTTRSRAVVGADNKVQLRTAEAQAPASASQDALIQDQGSTVDGLAKRADRNEANAQLGQRMLKRDAEKPAVADPSQHNPYNWMGHADEQRAIMLEQENRDKFEAKEINPVKQVASEPVSTFSTDVDTASYAFVRRALNSGHLPPKDAVRVEEMVNYFPYNYPAPETAEVPFKPTITVMQSPWNPNNKLAHVAIKGYDLKIVERPRANLVFLIDVSGSMSGEDRLPLIKNAFRLLLDQLKPEDTVGIVTYAGNSGIVLEPTKVSNRSKILSAIDKLGAGGSTAGAAGIQDAYRLAEAGFEKNSVNRIILATDGDFNVGVTDQNELKGLIERKRETGIFLSILGVGQGNHNDALMQTLAQNGNGTAAYVDTLNEARKVLVDQASSTLFTIAKDVKAQIEWNPTQVAEYRLIGYETRNLKREDFNNDRVDAGDIGSGHTVTAIYELTPVGAPKQVDDLRYAKVAAEAAAPAKAEAVTQAGEAKSSELGFLKLRYKRPNENQSQLVTLPISETPADQLAKRGVTDDVRFSTAVAAFGQMLKGEPYLQNFNFDDVLSLAGSARGDDPFGYRAEFLNLVRLAKSARP